VTAVGIGVAVGAVILFNFFSQRANRIATEMKLLTDEFLELLLEPPGETQPSRRARRDDERELADAHDKEAREITKRAKGDGDGDREAA
jgi:hypothetical protein